MKKISMIMYSIIGMCFLTRAIFAADVTVEDILSKMQQNIVGINDMKSDAFRRIYMNTQENTNEQQMKCLYKKPNKYRIETLKGSRVMLILDNTMTFKTGEGRVTQEDFNRVLVTDPRQEYFFEDISKILIFFNVILNDVLSDKINSIYVLEFSPKGVSLNTVNPFSKIEMYVDYEKETSMVSH